MGGEREPTRSVRVLPRPRETTPPVSLVSQVDGGVRGTEGSESLNVKLTNKLR